MADMADSIKASTIQQKKAYLFAVGWWYRYKYNLKKYPDAYNAAKINIGTKSLVFGVPRWPKKFERGPLQSELTNFYQLMERSLDNNEGAVRRVVISLLSYEGGSYHHDYLGYQVCVELWQDAVTEVRRPQYPYTSDSVAIAKQVWDKEDFGSSLLILCDSLEDSGHDFESSHLRTGRHSPACPVLRQIAGIK